MKVFFTILTIAGWAWTALLAVLLLIHLSRQKRRLRESEPSAIGHEHQAR